MFFLGLIKINPRNFFIGVKICQLIKVIYRQKQIKHQMKFILQLMLLNL
nr:MAG TPA: hypothetical protein [Caudoviricetes sp.]